MEELINKIKDQNCITLEDKEKYFHGKDFRYIRNWLEENSIDRHICLEVESAGVVIVIKNGGSKKVLLQIRATEKNRIGIFGRWIR